MSFTLTWAGECSAWECDELGHLNMRHYVYKTAQARAGLIIRMGLVEAFKADTSSSIRVKDFHIKYQGEARPGDSLKIESAVISLNEDTAQLCHIMYHANGRIASTVVETVEHIYLRERRKFAWPSRVRNNVEAFTVDLPSPAKPRNIDLTDPQTGMSLSELHAIGSKTTGAGVFGTDETDNTGSVTSQAIFGRVTSSIGWFNDGWPEIHDADYRKGGGMAALLEARAVFHGWPEAGDAYAYVPGFLGANTYTRTILHNLLSPLTGQSYMSMVAVGCLFNTNTRSLVKTTPEQVKQVNRAMIDGLHA